MIQVSDIEKFICIAPSLPATTTAIGSTLRDLRARNHLSQNGAPDPAELARFAKLAARAEALAAAIEQTD